MDWGMPGSSVFHYLAEFVIFMSVESVILSDITLWCFFSFCLQSFLTSGSFPVSKLFTGQIIGASTSVLPMNILGWFHLGLICLTFFSPKDFQESSPVWQFESINSLAFSLLYGPTLMSIHNYWKNHSFDYMDLCRQSDVCLLFSMLSRFVIAFLPKSKCLLISWLHHHLQWFWSPQNKACHYFHYFPIYFPWSDGTRCHDLSFLMLSFKPTFSLSSFTFIKRLLSSS